MAKLFSDWSLDELKSFKRKLEEMYLGGIRQSSFKDQTLIFSSTSELKQRLADVTTAVNDKELECGGSGTGATKTKKQVRATTRNKGFR